MSSPILQKLSEPFSHTQVKQRKGVGGRELDYVGWDTVVNRLNEVLGLDWSVTPISVNLSDEGLAYVVLSLDLLIDGKVVSRMGVGADKDARDFDKAIKTAQAEALKKAANLFGIALELWDESHRDSLQQQRDLDDLTVNQLKKVLIFNLKKTLNVEELSREEISEYLSVSVDDLDNPDVLKKSIISLDN